MRDVHVVNPLQDDVDVRDVHVVDPLQGDVDVRDVHIGDPLLVTLVGEMCLLL